MGLTISDIERDIGGFNKRIKRAKAKLARLPTGRLPYQGHRKIQKVRRDCQAEIEHCKGLIRYAEWGIEIRKGLRNLTSDHTG